MFSLLKHLLRLDATHLLAFSLRILFLASSTGGREGMNGWRPVLSMTVFFPASQEEGSTKMKCAVAGGRILTQTAIGTNEPLSLALSPLRGARELANRVVVIARCAVAGCWRVFWICICGVGLTLEGCQTNRMRAAQKPDGAPGNGLFSWSCWEGRWRFCAMMRSCLTG